jgi:hypothetical protein
MRLLLGFGLKQARHDPAVTVTEHRGTSIQTFGKGASLAFSGSTVLVSDRVDSITRMLDRTGKSGGSRHPLEEWASGFAEAYDMYGLLLNEDGRAAPLLERWTPSGQGADAGESIETGIDRVRSHLDPRAMVRARFGLDVTSADVLAGRAEAEFTDDAEAGEWQTALASELQVLREHAAAEGLELGVEESRSGRRAATRLQVSGIEQWIERKFAGMGQGAAPQAPPPGPEAPPAR